MPRPRLIVSAVSLMMSSSMRMKANVRYSQKISAKSPPESRARPSRRLKSGAARPK